MTVSTHKTPLAVVFRLVNECGDCFDFCLTKLYEAEQVFVACNQVACFASLASASKKLPLGFRKP